MPADSLAPSGNPLIDTESASVLLTSISPALMASGTTAFSAPTAADTAMVGAVTDGIGVGLTIGTVSITVTGNCAAACASTPEVISCTVAVIASLKSSPEFEAGVSVNPAS